MGIILCRGCCLWINVTPTTRRRRPVVVHGETMSSTGCRVKQCWGMKTQLQFDLKMAQNKTFN